MASEMAEPKSVEQAVRDILQAAFEEGLVHLLDSDSDGVHPQEMSSGDLVGPANALEQWLKSHLASKDAEIERLKGELAMSAGAWRELTNSNMVLRSERDALAAQVEELKRDAERYIELRDGDCPLAVADICLIQNRGALVGGKLDVELDAWIAARAAEAAAIQEPSRDE